MRTPYFLVVGTDTDVGKTEVSCCLLKQLAAEGTNVGAYKPACSGSEISENGQPTWNDVDRLFDAIGKKFPKEQISPQTFHAPAAPPQAAELENRKVNESLLIDGLSKWDNQVELVLIEGVGGLLSPLSENWTNLDFAKQIGCPILIVGRLGLGTINHTLMTVQIAQSAGIPIMGIVLSETVPCENDPSVLKNVEEIEKRSGCQILGVLPYGTEPGLLRSGKPVKIDWQQLLADSSV